MNILKELQTTENLVRLDKRLEYIKKWSDTHHTIPEDEKYNIAVSMGFVSAHHMTLYLFFDHQTARLEFNVLKLLHDGANEDSKEVLDALDEYEHVKCILDNMQDPFYYKMFKKDTDGDDSSPYGEDLLQHHHSS